MSGHSKWHSIRHKKGAVDAARGKIFTKHGNLITIAAREGGGDPDMNPGLRLAIDKAKAENMPNANIDRAIKRGTGEDKEGAQFYEMQYEGYGPEGVAIIVNALTDNKNRTVASVRTCFTKHGGSLGETGCVGWMFEKKGVIRIPFTAEDKEELQLQVIDAGAEDVTTDGDELEVITAFADFFDVKEALEKQNVKINNAEIALLPQNTVAITDEATGQKILHLIAALDDDDDVSNVSANFDISDELLTKISDED